LPCDDSRVGSVQDVLRARSFIEHSAMPATRAVSLNFGFALPGLYEIAGGATLREIIALAGGANDAFAIQLGGPLGRIYTLDEATLTLDEAIRRSPSRNISLILWTGAAGAGAARRVAEFCALESCGKCVPCRLGSFRLLQQLPSPPAADAGQASTEAIVEALEHGSLCRLGRACGEQMRNLMRAHPASPATS
jgi:bidirectional [NiFe] hydrogenase diaphorase subunit